MMKTFAGYVAIVLCLSHSVHFFSQCTQQNIVKRGFLVSSNLQVIFMTFQKVQLKNSLASVNMGSKLDVKRCKR